MKVQTQVTIGDSSTEVAFICTVQGFPGNCGAEIITDCSLRVTYPPKTENGWGAVENRMLPSTMLEALDVLWPSIEKNVNKYGFVVITDNMASYDEAQLGKSSWSFLDANTISDKVTFRTKHFVQYLILRKLGYVGRGLTTRNELHQSSSVITSWTWCPRDGNLLSFEQDIYTPDGIVSPTKTSATLTKICSEYLTKERSLSTSGVATHAKKASKPRVSRSKVAGCKPAAGGNKCGKPVPVLPRRAVKGKDPLLDF